MWDRQETQMGFSMFGVGGLNTGAEGSDQVRYCYITRNRFLVFVPVPDKAFKTLVIS